MLRLPLTLLGVVACLLSLSYVGPVGGQGVNLSPATWPADVFKTFQQLNDQSGPHPPAFSLKGMVSGTSSAFAIHAGVDALNKGGNAMDACLTTALTQVTLATGAYVSYAGIANILFYNATSGDVRNINGEWNRLLNGPTSINQIPPIGFPGPNGNTVLTPGFFAGVDAAAKSYATFPLATLLEPAIYFAEQGFNLSPLVAGLAQLEANNVTLFRTAEGKALWTNPATGKIYQAGDLFKQPQAAAVLRGIATQGISYFYKGDWATKAVNAVAQQKGSLSLEDLSSFKAQETEARSTTYETPAFGDVTMYAPAYLFGGVDIIEAINLIEIAIEQGYISQPYDLNATSLFWLMFLSRWGDFMSSIYLIEPAAVSKLFPELDLSFSSRVTKKTSADIWRVMTAPGGVARIQAAWKKLFPSSTSALFNGKHSDGVVAVDSSGNICSMVHSANSFPWGSGIFVEGIALPNAAAVQPAVTVLASKPGGRVPSPISPVIGINLNSPSNFSLALSTIGSGLHSFTVQMIPRLLNWMQTPKAGTDGSFFCGPDPKNLLASQVGLDAFEYEMLEEVEKMGQPLTITPRTSRAGEGWPVAILSTQVDGVSQLQGAATPNGNGYAEGQ